MLWTIVAILLIVWLLGATGLIAGIGAGLGGLLHVLLVVAIIIIIFNFIQGRRGGGPIV